jgi:hypothetical protein
MAEFPEGRPGILPLREQPAPNTEMVRERLVGRHKGGHYQGNVWAKTRERPPGERGRSKLRNPARTRRT